MNTQASKFRLAVATAAVLLAAAAFTALPASPIAAAVAADAPVPASAGDELQIVSAQFGVLGTDSTGRRALFETVRLPAVEAMPFGWYIVFESSKLAVVVREEFELPEPPPTWGAGEAAGAFFVSPDRKTAVTERIVSTGVGFAANVWRYAPGDPVGAHAMRVYIDGQLVREFKFDIEELPQPNRPARPVERGADWI